MLAIQFLLALLAVPNAGDPAQKIHPALREAFALRRAGDTSAAAEQFRVYAVLSEQLQHADFEDALDGLSRKDRRVVVVDRLRRHADRTQRNVLALLDNLKRDGSVKRVHQLWIANTVIFNGTAASIEAVARLPEVERIGWDPPRDPEDTQDQRPFAGSPTRIIPEPYHVPVIVYYEQDFESGVLGPEFATTTTNCGTVAVTGQYGPVGSYHAAMYATTEGCDSTARLTLTVDLSGAANVALRYSFKDIDDEFDAGEDVVEASDDGGASWTPIANLSATVENVHAPHTHVLDGLGLDYVSNFKIRWSWRDRSRPPEDGFGIDEIVIQDRFLTTPPPAPQPNLVQLQATELWDLGFTGQGVSIMNLDRGADYRHPDLAGRIFRNPLDPIDGVDNDNNGYVDDAMGWDFIEDDNDPLPSFFYGEHGTNTAGIMVGDGASGLARTGMAPGATMAIVRINGESDHWLGIQWGLSVGIDCNSSSNSYRWDQVPKPDYHLHRAVHDKVLEAGVIHANSIGNLAGLPQYPIPFQITTPSDCPAPWRHPDQLQDGGGVSAVMAVGGIELDDTLFTPTSIGPCAWDDMRLYDRNYPNFQTASFWDYPVGGFGGPGQGLIKPDVVAYSNVVTTNGPNGYLTSFWGTSASTPHVGGAFALLLSVAPDASPAEICQALQSTAIDMGVPGKDSTYGAGRIQVKDAAMQLMALLRSNTSRPRLGERYVLTVHGPAGSPYVVAFSSKEPPSRRSRHGWSLAGPVGIVASGVLDAQGKATLRPIAVPNAPSLIGGACHYQVLVDDCWGKTGEMLYSPVATITIRDQVQDEAAARFGEPASATGPSAGSRNR